MARVNIISKLNLALLIVFVVGVSAEENINECGRVVPQGAELIVSGKREEFRQLPWHVAVYSKQTKPYKYICGGSLISNNIVLSGATCFWRDVEQLLPASEFAVAAGKMYRPWSNDHDVSAQKSDVKEIHIPARYRGHETNYGDDIAVVILTAAFEYKAFVRPVCLNFDPNFQKLQPGQKGKVPSWGMKPTGSVVEISYVDVSTCITESLSEFRAYIVSDKMCAKTDPSNLVCRGDSGNGLAFSEMEKGTDRYYLRGIVSVSPRSHDDDDGCVNRSQIIGFTDVLKHADFINGFLTEKSV